MSARPQAKSSGDSALRMETEADGAINPSREKRGAVEILERGDDAVKVGPPDGGRQPERLLPNWDRQLTDDREAVILPEALETVISDAVCAAPGGIPLEEARL